MGMFDTFFDNNAKIICPHCNAPLDLENGVQSKAFDCTLAEYKVGDMVDDIQISRELVNDYDWCNNCKEQVPLYFAFHHTIFTGIFQTAQEGLDSIKSFDVYKHYNLHYREKEELKTELHTIKYRLKDTIKIHGSSAAKTNFGILYSIHHKFIDYDIIQTLKNILKYD